ncbi:MAG: hypothetical protein HOI66_20680 [Verrucomicrobia bacterium]|nr:hypothetical protein [Verrucomicrobiota bacterium]
MNNRKLILSTFLLSAIFAVVIKASIQVPGSGGTPEANISNTYIADVAVCESGRDEELSETDKEVSQANSAAVFIAAGCGRRCTLTVIGGPAAVGVCVSRCLGWLTLGIAFNEGIAYSNRLEIYDEYDDWIAEAREKRDSALANLL